MTEVTFKITEHIGVIKANGNGWTRELNIVSWNGGEPKYDIREWDPHHERMSRGITMTAEEIAAVTKLYQQRHNSTSSDATFA